MQTDITIKQYDEPPHELYDHIRQQLIDFNKQHVGEFPHKALVLVAYDTKQEIIAGLLGEVAWGWLHVNILWVSESYRHAHLGSSLMDRAEAEAVKMGVNQAYLETTDFQAAGFYEKRGYHIFAQLENHPPGHFMYYMKNTDLGNKSG